MAFGDNAMDVGDLDTAIARLYSVSGSKVQFHRHGITGKWLGIRTKAMKGTRMEFNAFTTPMSAMRKSDWATASVGAFPAARDFDEIWLSYDYADLNMIWGTIKFNILEQRRSEDRDTSIWRLSTKLFNELNGDFTENVNRAFNQDSACQMALVSAVYDSDGTSYTPSATSCFIKIKSGQIGQFHQSMVLNTNATEECTVQDVIYGKDVTLEGVTTTGVGPGIRVSVAGGNCDGITADDPITMSGETTGDNIHGLPDWFSKTTNVYFNEAGGAIDRDAATYDWSIPFIYTAAAAGSEEEFSLDTHMRPVANTLAHMLGARNRAKAIRKSAEGDIVFPSSLVAITTPELLNFVVNEANSTQQFTMRAATSMDAAQRKELFGNVGFQGMVYDSPTMGSVAFECDPAAPPYKIRFLEPSSWFVLSLHDGAKRLQWLQNGGQRLQPVLDYATTQRPTFYVQAAAYTTLALVCDQPRANVEITGVTDDL